MAIKDYSYPDIQPSDFIDESLNKILDRDDAAKIGFRRVKSLPSNVTENDIGMKVYLVGKGNYQLMKVSPEPSWKRLTDDTRTPAYMDTLQKSYQPLSSLLTSLAKWSNVSNVFPYIDGPNDFQIIQPSNFNFIKNLLLLNNAKAVRDYLGLGTMATLNSPINGAKIADGSITAGKLDNSFVQQMIWTTGDMKLTYKTTADDGWILITKDDTILGNAGCTAATYKGTVGGYSLKALYEVMWKVPGAKYTTSAGADTTKGSSATADWNANKGVKIPNMLGRALAVKGDGHGLGGIYGDKTVTLTMEQIPQHTHVLTLNQFKRGKDGDYQREPHWGGGDCTDGYAEGANKATTTARGGGKAHNNIPPTVYVNIMIKL